MNTIKKLMTLLALLMPSIAVAAVAEDVYDFKVDGIYYKIANDEACVTYKSFSYIDHDPHYESDYAGDVVIPPTVTYDGKTYPVTSIGSCAFYRRSAVTSITIPSSITSIGWSAFFDCTGLTRVTITDLAAWCNIDIDYNSNPLYYAQHLYLNDTEVTDLVIPEGITEIDGFAFYGCVGLTSVTIPNSVTSIGEGAFMECSQLSSVTCLATTPPVIKYENCFDNECYSNSTLFVPASAVNMYIVAPIWEKFIVKSIGSDNPTGEGVYDFEVDGIYYKIVNDEACVTYKSFSYISHDPHYESDYTGDVVIPSSVTHDGKTYPVTSIGDHAFYRRMPLTSITIPSSITSIGWDAFWDCTGLTRVTVTDLTAWCNIDNNSNPLYFAHHLYLNDTEVTDLVIPDGVTAIRKHLFEGCTGLTSVIIPNSATAIGENAFAVCSGLTRVTTGNGVTEIEPVAFEGCTALTSVTLGNAVTTIGGSAFAGCTALTGIVIPNSVTSIGGGAFSGCTSLASATIGKCVTSIGSGAFRGCESLTSINIPNSVTEIGTQAFSGCSGLASVTIGHSVATIGKDAFQNDPAIEIVTCKATVPPSWEDLSMFTQNVYNHTPLFVPLDCERAYVATPYWGQFLSIFGTDIEDDSDEGIAGDVNGDGEVTIADANNVIDIVVMGGNAGHTRIPEADVNEDGEINIADINAIIDIILRNNIGQ